MRPQVVLESAPTVTNLVPFESLDSKSCKCHVVVPFPGDMRPTNPHISPTVVGNCLVMAEVDPQNSELTTPAQCHWNATSLGAEGRFRPCGLAERRNRCALELTESFAGPGLHQQRKGEGTRYQSVASELLEPCEHGKYFLLNLALLHPTLRTA